LCQSYFPHLSSILTDSFLKKSIARTTISKENRERFSVMADNVSSAAASDDPLKSVADALETAVQAAKDGAQDAKASAENALPAVSRFLSRFVYATCYTVSYGVVFPTVLIAKSIPSDNAVVNGLVDGARAASDMVDQLKSRQIVSQVAVPSTSLPS
jgi:hypothetical protein